MSIVNELVYSLTEADWQVETVSNAGAVRDSSLPDALRSWKNPRTRGFFDFLTSVRYAFSSDSSAWLLSLADYTACGGKTSAWDEFRRISLGSAKNDFERQRIERFWNDHLPICMSVGGCYTHFSLCRDGSVVTGIEPEFENVSTVCDSFDQFVDLLASGNIDLGMAV